MKYLDYYSLTCLLDLLKRARDLFHELILNSFDGVTFRLTVVEHDEQLGWTGLGDL